MRGISDADLIARVEAGVRAGKRLSEIARDNGWEPKTLRIGYRRALARTGREPVLTQAGNTIRPAHRYSYLFWVRQYWRQSQRGAVLSGSARAQLDVFLRTLPDGVVIDYAPDSVEGFFLRPRRESDPDTLDCTGLVAR